MPRPSEAYRDGYQKGQRDNISGNVSEAMMGMLRDDPGGHFAAGYRDGAGRKKFSPPSDVPAPQPKQVTESKASDLEKEWYRLCNGTGFIPKETVDWYVSALRAEGSHVAIVVGLSDFTGQRCPRCAAEGHFKIRFLGRLQHAAPCGWSGYMGTGSYIGHQIAQVFHTGIRAGGAMKDEADKGPDGRGNWMGAIFGFLFVAIWRAAAAVVLIPLHCVAALSQPGQTRADTTTRVVTLAVMLTLIGVGVIELKQNATRHAPAQQFSGSPPPLASGHTFIQLLAGPESQFQGWQSTTMTVLRRAHFNQLLSGVVYSGTDVLTPIPPSDSRSEIWLYSRIYG